MKISDLANATLWRLYKVFLRIQLALQLRADRYAPDPFATPTASSDPRGSAARAAAVLKHLPDEPLAALDVGCHLGYFTFALARRGGFCIGVDVGRNGILAAHALSILNRVGNVAFAQIDINKKTSAALPYVDVVFCLSVYHHWVRKLGRSTADEIVTNLARRAGRYFVFDTGQPDETGAEWAEKVAFMLPNIEAFLSRYLADLGFAKVTHIGTYPTTVSPVPRHLFIAER